ncbi:alpha/beta-hydrolase [Vararia minispora EC-137]|uniref:Alpha/beta-hydrolase n=1 Tax=Vararia minispora EC-137 TaxID=1314806 RepID=A0ACB8QI35_9AGAM|nr:alpha/beta-hydrolase [Vararia minispora EC-137]
MSFCKHCVEGVRHEGTAEGTYEEIGGIKTYVAKPKGDYPKDKAILFLTDIFGLELPNNPLLVDDYARNGFQVYAPDLFEGDPAPANLLTTEGTPFDLQTWFPKHSGEHTGKRARAVLEALKAQGITRWGAVGYCYGARLVWDLSYDKLIHVSACSHPSLIQPEDVEKYAKECDQPLLINSCETDPQFPAEKQELADKVFADYKPGYSRPYFPGATHGFAVRGDLSDPKVKAAKEGAFKNTVEWFIKYL